MPVSPDEERVYISGDPLASFLEAVKIADYQRDIEMPAFNSSIEKAGLTLKGDVNEPAQAKKMMLELNKQLGSPKSSRGGTIVIFDPQALTGNKKTPLTSLPEEIGQLSNLKVLNLAYNKIHGLPETFAKLSNLESLNLAHNGLTTFPPEIAKLRNLKKLDLSDNKIESLPREFFNLKNLKELKLDYLKNLPDKKDLMKLDPAVRAVVVQAHHAYQSEGIIAKLATQASTAAAKLAKTISADAMSIGSAMQSEGRTISAGVSADLQKVEAGFKAGVESVEKTAQNLLSRMPSPSAQDTTVNSADAEDKTGQKKSSWFKNPFSKKATLTK